MPFDFKKEYKEFYLPPKTPALVDVPPMRYIAVRGQGDPNREDGEYKRSIGLLYAIAYTVKMSEKAGHRIDGYFSYVVPPLEGFWWQEETATIDYSRKDDFRFVSVLRLPDFVTREVFDWAIDEATHKKKIDFSDVEFFEHTEGLCVQCMHVGCYDAEPKTLASMHVYAASIGYAPDITDTRRHHEIYLSDPRRCAPEACKTVIRIPVRKIEGK